MFNGTPTQTVTHFGVGIDTHRYGHQVTFLNEDRQPAAKPLMVKESHEGYQALEQVLRRLQAEHPHAHFHVRIDAAGQYAINLERFLRRLSLPMTLSVGQPKRNKDYQRVHFPKRKSDVTESHAMARFAVVERPEATPVTEESLDLLRDIASRLHAQAGDTTRTINRLHKWMARAFPELATLVPDLAAASLLTLLSRYPTAERIARAKLASLTAIPYLDADKAAPIHAAAQRSVATLQGPLAEAVIRDAVQQVQHAQNTKKALEKLLLEAYRELPAGNHRQVETIPGIGAVTAAVLISKIGSIDRFPSPAHLVGYFGLFPEENTSGVDRFGQPISPGTLRMSPKGNDLVRAYLWNAAKAAIVHNPAVRALYRRLRARGTRGDVALGHCMAKLLHLVFAVWTSGQPFDKDHYPWEQTAAPESGGVPAAQENTAGHRDSLPQETKVVTAVNCSVETPSPQVKPSASQTSPKPSVDYTYLREQITIEQVLRHLGVLDQLRGCGSQRRGPCPIHHSERPTSRSFSVNLTKHVFQCFHGPCAAQGNALDLWAAARGLSLHDAALDLAQTFHLQVNRNREEEPVIRNRKTSRPPKPKRHQKSGVITPDAY
jgi:transposase